MRKQNLFKFRDKFVLVNRYSKNILKILFEAIQVFKNFEKNV